MLNTVDGVRVILSAHCLNRGRLPLELLLVSFFGDWAQVKNEKCLSDSLGKLVVEDEITDYFCDECRKKVPLLKKRTVLGDLPPIVVLQVR